MKNNTKSLILLLFLLWGTNCFSQNLLMEFNLNKFSCLIYGRVSAADTICATGFFLKQKTKTYLITNCHVFSGWDPIAFKADKMYPDTLYVRVSKKHKRNAYDLLPIVITEIKKKSAEFYFFEKPDLAMLKIELPADDTVYYLNDYVNKAHKSDRPTKVIAWGFPDRNSSSVSDYKSKEGMGYVLNDTYQKKIIMWKGAKKDSLNYIVSYTNSLSLGPGFSGSPVFYYKPFNKDGVTIDKYYWAGILFGGDNEHGFVIKPDAVKNELRKQLGLKEGDVF